MTDEPPPLPAKKNPDREAFAFQAAKLGAALPFVAIAIAAGLNAAFLNHEPAQRAKLTLMVGGIAVLVVLIGLLLSLFALIRIPKHGASGILLPALLGLLIPGLLAAIAIPNFIKAREAAIENRKRGSSIVEAQDEMLAELRKGFSEEEGLADTSEARRKYQERLAAAAQNMSGDQGIALRATAAFSRKQQIRVSAFEKISKDFVDAELLELTTITNRDQLAHRKEAAQRFLGDATEMKTFISGLSGMLRTELDQTTLSDQKKDEFVRGFLNGGQRNIDMGMQIREQDIRIANAMMGVFELLHNQWGNWENNLQAGTVDFESGDAIEKFHAHFAEINEAAAEQVRLQKAILERSAK
ncbi:MAG: hypothetical protein ACJASX_001762 [Limisphaerales bacterium]|jgi:hypothetical protein